jgi:hypothetical protein
VWLELPGTSQPRSEPQQRCPCGSCRSALAPIVKFICLESQLSACQTKEFLRPVQKGEAPPASVKYAPAPLCVKRYLFLSDRYRAERAVLCDLIKEASEMPGSRWTLFNDIDAWRATWTANRATSFAIFPTADIESGVALTVVPESSVAGTKFFDNIKFVSIKHSCDGMTVH